MESETSSIALVISACGVCLANKLFGGGFILQFGAVRTGHNSQQACCALSLLAKTPGLLQLGLRMSDKHLLIAAAYRYFENTAERSMYPVKKTAVRDWGFPLALVAAESSALSADAQLKIRAFILQRYAPRGRVGDLNSRVALLLTRYS